MTAKDGPFVKPKYPQPGDVYDSRLYPGQKCEVLDVANARVTIKWAGQYDHVAPQIVTVSQFIRDFTVSTAEA